MSLETDKRFHLDDWQEYARLNSFMGYNNIEISELDEDHSLLKHIVNENSVNINGNAHGGLTATMMDIAAAILVRKNGTNCATSSMHTSFLRPGHGTLFARAEFVKRGKKLNVVHAFVYDEADQLIADATVNMFVID